MKKKKYYKFGIKHINKEDINRKKYGYIADTNE